MKFFLIYLSIILFSISSYSQPLWEQIDSLTCKKEFITNCREHICKLEKVEANFKINFKTNLINFPNINRSREILYKEYIDVIDHYNNSILTAEEQINIMSSETNGEYKFNLVNSSHHMNQSHVQLFTGKCIVD